MEGCLDDGSSMSYCHITEKNNMWDDLTLYTWVYQLYKKCLELLLGEFVDDSNMFRKFLE